MSLQKHLLNAPATLVSESLQGLCAVNPQLAYDPENQVVYKRTIDPSKVAVICGGGSGHEPSHAGFVGEGILSAAVCGSVFASPNASQVRRGIDLVENDARNYTGDVLNFGLAKEQYAAEHGKKPNQVKFLVVGDDVAVGKTQGDIVGRRGLAGVVLVYKIAGALAAQGGSLDEVYSIAQYVSSRIGTIGVGLEHCHVPGTATGETHLSADEIEIGLGIHNESGNKRIKPVPPLKRSFLPFKNDGKDEVVLLLELGGIAHAANEELKTRKVVVSRIISGTFMTSLNMPGFSISLVLLPRDEDSGAPKASKILSLLDAKAETPGWKWTSTSKPNASFTLDKDLKTKAATKSTEAGSLSAADPKAFIEAIKRACQAVVKEEPEITRMDTIAGDGDCGLTLKAGSEGNIKGIDLVNDIVDIAKVAEKKMGGTSGALYSIFFSGLAQGLQANAGSSTTVTDDIWKLALSDALAKLYTYTRARPPSRTLIDPLAAFITNVGQGFPSAVKEASDAAEYTKNVKAKAGRSAYVDSNLLTKEQVPDPGAWGVRAILQALFL
ncbi:dihydroxyacetone kinase [Desarmillaria tabescens]|uniref:Dihydroxyacetone kinase n=1 Tax=Armillaria tabescens TaxID=1929756 RepID=A0AA39NI94_ARMTA|nr:dihydroxyacetone kinase [Desarmillaria tabescens]KAK0466143.1 dihydroxyacetone kinase [Desarmillaria tabescens]